MRYTVVGGGPSGLYFAFLAKKQFPSVQIDVYEQNPKGATYGFGIVLADRGLSRLQKADAESCQAILASVYATRHQVITHRGESIFVERAGWGGAISRLRLLEILQDHCEGLGVRIHYQTRVEGNVSDSDLVVGADGVNSIVRQLQETAFGTTSWHLTNRMAWYGTTRHFPYPILTFKSTAVGRFWTAAYPYTERMSTFVAECDAESWVRSGLDKMNDAERQAMAEQIFAAELDGHKLINNNSAWRNLPVVRNQHWYVGRHVLIGDALHSAHPTIGSGTRIAMEDAIDLADALQLCSGDVPTALALFERTRRPAKQKLIDAAEKSFTWYEQVAAKMDQFAAVPFVFDFMTRTGRINHERLLREFPVFMRRYGEGWNDFQRARGTL